MAYLQTLTSGASTTLSVIPNGVDLARLQPNIVPKQANKLIFNGALTYSVNYDAMRYFLVEIFPRIRALWPDVSLTITGSTEGVDLGALPLDESVHLSGYVSDIRPLVASATACVAPLRQGGGTRLKILEAMALGTPVISTAKGMEGLDAVDGQHYLLGRDAEAFADQTVRLLKDGGLRGQIAANARGLVETKYDWMEIGRVFRGLVEEIAAGKRA